MKPPNTMAQPIDHLIAKHVMGLTVPDFPGQDPKSLWDDRSIWLMMHGQYPYSTDISAAWTVVEKMIEKGCDFELYKGDPGGFDCHFTGTGLVHGKTAPQAICIAALKALEIG